MGIPVTKTTQYRHNPATTDRIFRTYFYICFLLKGYNSCLSNLIYHITIFLPSADVACDLCHLSTPPIKTAS